MDRTAAYSIIITRTTTGYTAYAPAFPDIISTARGSRVAYARLKILLKTRVLRLLADMRPLPRDPVVQTKTIRLDLWYLRQQEELR
jgi:predicted RNase H-like HicB family nuclease